MPSWTAALGRPLFLLALLISICRKFIDALWTVLRNWTRVRKRNLAIGGAQRARARAMVRLGMVRLGMAARAATSARGRRPAAAGRSWSSDSVVSQCRPPLAATVYNSCSTIGAEPPSLATGREASDHFTSTPVAVKFLRLRTAGPSLSVDGARLKKESTKVQYTPEAGAALATAREVTHPEPSSYFGCEGVNNRRSERALAVTMGAMMAVEFGCGIPMIVTGVTDAGMVMDLLGKKRRDYEMLRAVRVGADLGDDDAENFTTDFVTTDSLMTARKGTVIMLRTMATKMRMLNVDPTDDRYSAGAKMLPGTFTPAAAVKGQGQLVLFGKLAGRRCVGDGGNLSLRFNFVGMVFKGVMKWLRENMTVVGITLTGMARTSAATIAAGPSR